MPAGVVDHVGLAVVEGKAQILSRLVDFALTHAGLEGWRFVLCFVEYDGAGTAYVSSVPRESASAVLRAQADRLEARPLAPGVEQTMDIRVGPRDRTTHDHGGLPLEKARELLEATGPLRDLLQDQLPPGWGFLLPMRPPPPRVGSYYVATCEREDAVPFLRELADAIEQQLDRPPGRLGKDA